MTGEDMTVPDIGRGIGFLGGGNMGRALISSLLRRGVEPKKILVTEAHAPAAAALCADFGVELVAAHELPQRSDVIVLAVKPQDMAAALQPMRVGLAGHRPLVISVAAGLSVPQLQAWCSDDGTVPVVRAMPNRPALHGVGATGLYALPSLGERLRRQATAVMEAAGIVVWVEDESLMDVVTAISGSGPAYFFRLAEALAAAGTAQGLSPEAARQLATATLRGAGAMALPEAILAELRESVTSKGGTTAAALAAFTDRDLEGVVAAAVDAAVRRGRELALQAARGS